MRDANKERRRDTVALERRALGSFVTSRFPFFFLLIRIATEDAISNFLDFEATRNRSRHFCVKEVSTMRCGFLADARDQDAGDEYL